MPDIIIRKGGIITHSLLVTATNVFDNIVFFAVNIAMARYLPVEMYGEYTSAIAIATLFMTFSDIGINQYFIQSVSLKKENASLTAGTMLVLKISVSLIVFSLLALFLHASKLPSSTIILTLIFGLVRLTSDFLKTIFDLYDARQEFILSSLLKSSFSIIVLLSAVAAIIMHGNYYLIFSLRLAASAIFTGALIFITATKESVRPEFSSAHIVHFVKQSIPFGISTVLLNSYQRINIVMLTLISGTYTSGIFSNAYMFFSTLFFIPGSISRVLLSFLYNNNDFMDKQKMQTTFDLYSKAMSIIGFFAAMILYLFADNIINLIFGKSYDQSAPILKIVSLSIPFIFSMAGTFIISTGKQLIKTVIDICTVPVCVLSNIILINIYSAKGAAISVIITFGFSYTLYHLFLHYSGKINVSSIVDTAIKLTAICTLCNFAWDILDSYMVLTYGIALITLLYVGCVLLFVLKKDELLLFKKVIFSHRH